MSRLQAEHPYASDSPLAAPLVPSPLSEAQRRRLLVDWNTSARSYPHELCAHTLFEAQAARTPNADALIFESRTISYRALNRRANQIARALQARGVGPDTLIGLAMDRSVEQIVGVLGILKAGAAYVPLDPKYPAERLALMLADTAAPLVLTQRHLYERLPTAHAQILVIDEQPDTTAADDENPVSAVSADSLAYVIYTSGSTGTPKGVLIDHRGLVNHTFAMIESHALQASDRVLQFSSLGFDASAATLFPALSAGAALVLPVGAPTELVGDQLTRLCEHEQITILQLPASIWHQWVDTLWLHRQPLQAPIRVLLVGGESPSVEKLRLWARLAGRRMKFLNAYGPTEAAITTTLYELNCDEATAATITSIPMGRPLPNKQVYILDPYQQLVPIGTTGEIYIGGIGLARGYLNRPDLTAERFISWSPPGPGDAGPGAPIRLYRTGDLARYRADGQIEFLGRVDHQIKIRGYRIELGEIEAVLRQHPQVRDTVVIAREDVPGLPQLVAYVVPQPPEAAAPPGGRLDAELSMFLWTKLPAFMIPAQFVPIAAIPLNANGKLDRKALPTPGELSQAPQPADRPESPEEIILANIWAQVLGRAYIGSTDNFFALGGHSLAAARAVALAGTMFDRKLPLRMLFEAPTVSAFVRAMHGHDESLAVPKPEALRAQAVLDPAIRPAAPWRPGPNPPQAILLTGVTGYLGAFLLHELLARTAAQIYCLIRADDQHHAMLRLKQTLARYRIGGEGWQQRVTLIVGDLRKPLLGVEPELFQRLAGTIDQIYHSAAEVHYLHPYAALKQSNVDGTIEVLRLACIEKVKPVHYISTLAVALSADHEGTIAEDAPVQGCTSIKGYDQSKWVAEMIVAEARARGLPAAIYRPGRIGGHSLTGVGNPDDFLTRLICGCVQLGVAPDIPLVESLLPVDVAAQAIVHLAQQPDLANTTFHLHNPQHISWAWIVDTLQDLGYAIRRVPYDEWHRAMVSVVPSDPDHALYSLMSFFPQDIAGADWIDVLSRYQFDITNTLAGLAGSDIRIPAIDAAILDHMVVDFVQQALIAEPLLARRAAYAEPAAIAP